MGKLTVLGLRIVIALALGGSLFLQVVMIPLVAVNEADPGGLAAAGIAIIAVLVLGLLAFQVAAVCVWRLLTLVRRGRVFSSAAFLYVDIVVAACAVASLLVFALAALVAPGDEVPPGMVLLLGGLGVVIAGIALIVLVLRQLLAQAIDRDTEAGRLRSELDEVI